MQAIRDAGWLPDLLPETDSIRRGDGIVAHATADLRDRRVEHSDPVGRTLIINVLDSRASVDGADFEVSHSPNREAASPGRLHLKDAFQGTIEYISPEGKCHSLNSHVAILLVRPRERPLPERHVLVHGRRPSASWTTAAKPPSHASAGAEDLDQTRSVVGPAAFASGTYFLASRIFDDLVTRKDFVRSLTLPDYEHPP